MGRETEPHDFPSCPGAAKLWYNDASYRASSNCKREYIPITLYKGNWITHFQKIWSTGNYPIMYNVIIKMVMLTMKEWEILINTFC